MKLSSNGVLKVAWISDFPIEWLPNLPASVPKPPREHSRSWQRVLLPEIEKDQAVQLHVVMARKQFERSLSFELGRTAFHLVKTPPLARAPSLFWIDTVLIRQVLRRVRPDVVHAWGTEKGAALVASRLGLPYIATVQGLLSWYRECLRLPAYERFAALLERPSLTRAPVVTAESRFTCDYVRTRFGPPLVKHIEVVPDRLFHQVQRKPRLRPFRIICVAQLSTRKGGDVLLAALDQLKDLTIELIVVGGCDSSIRDLVTRPELWKAITFRTNLSSSDVAEELSQAALLVCPTRADTGPMAVKEAVVAGVPVVGSRLGGLLDYIVEGANGYLVPAGDPAELSRAIRTATQHPLFGKGLVDDKVLARMRAYLSPELMGRKFVETYRSVYENSRN